MEREKRWKSTEFAWGWASREVLDKEKKEGGQRYFGKSRSVTGKGDPMK